MSDCLHCDIERRSRPNQSAPLKPLHFHWMIRIADTEPDIERARLMIDARLAWTLEISRATKT